VRRQYPESIAVAPRRAFY